MTEKQKLYFKVTMPIFSKIYNNEEVSLEEIKEAFSEYLPHSNKSERLFFESVVNTSDIDEAVNSIKNSDAYGAYKSMLETSEKIRADIVIPEIRNTILDEIKPFLKKNVVSKDDFILKDLITALEKKSVINQSNKNLKIEPFLGSEIRQLEALYAVKDAVYDHKESTDETIDLHKEQIHELKGHTSQNEKTIELHTKELNELNTANKALKTQVSQLNEVVQLIIEHLEESRNQTGELADTNAKIHIQIEQTEEELRKQKETNAAQSKKNKILFTLTIISFCITVLTALSNPNIYNFLKKFLGK
jgi:chromosome segregation ATPase